MKIFALTRFFRKILYYLSGMICVILITACDKEEPDPPVQPMYGVPSGKYVKQNTKTKPDSISNSVIYDQSFKK